MAKRAKKRRCCVYCGFEGGKSLTVDHIPPRCLFSKPYPPNLYTVPACRKCHDGTSLDDEYFRTMLSLRHDTFDHPDVAKNIEAVSRTFENSPGFAKSFLAVSSIERVLTATGAKWRPSFNVDIPRLHRVMKRITRALYWRETRVRLPNDYTVLSLSDDEFNDLTEGEKLNLEKLIDTAIKAPENRMGDVLNYKCTLFADDPLASIWILTVYGQYSFATATVPPK